MPTTAWRFSGTEGADSAVVRLKALYTKDLINLMDIAVLRWPEYADQPTTTEHAHEQGGKVSHLVRRLQHPVIDGSMIESVKGDLRPGTSAVVVLSSMARSRPSCTRSRASPWSSSGATCPYPTRIGCGRPSSRRSSATRAISRNNERDLERRADPKPVAELEQDCPITRRR